MFRSRIRKFCLLEGIDVLAENATDKENCVRFALFAGSDASAVITFVKTLFDCSVEKVLEEVENPVLSKLKVNIAERYTI